jgi:hypothetical protein
MPHIKAVDGQQHTVILIQVENEVGVLGDSCDRSPATNRQVLVGATVLIQSVKSQYPQVWLAETCGHGF